MADLEHVLQQLHGREINAGIKMFYDAGMKVWIGDQANGISTERRSTRRARSLLPVFGRKDRGKLAA